MKARRIQLPGKGRLADAKISINLASAACPVLIVPSKIHVIPGIIETNHIPGMACGSLLSKNICFFDQAAE